MSEIVFSILMFVLGLGLGIVILVIINNLKIKNSGNKAELIIEKAKKDADKLKRDSLFEAKEEIHKLKLENEKEMKEKKNEIKESEDRLLQRESNIDRRDVALQNRENSLEERENNLLDKQRKIQEATEEMEEIKKEQLDKLEKISKFTKEQAHDAIMKNVEEKMGKEIASYIKEKEAEAKLEVDDKARALLVGCMQKYAADITNEQTVSVITLPSDEMKGRIIGREGRNIRTIESVTGVDLIIDDTPEAIVISSFDPLRREIARLTLENLIKDGRIHPARIEELYDKMCSDVNQKIIEYGKEAVYSLGLSKIDPELVEIIGKLHFRSSYGQNALKHSIEVARISGLIAGEIGENVTIAKRAGLLHDIGKAIDFEMEGSHVKIGVDLAKKYNEDDVVINAIASHHGDTEPTNIISVIVAIADTISASRPGARNDSSENYFQRLEQLEKIGNEIKGVEKTYAVQAGRELRVMVKPDEVDDLRSFAIAREIKDSNQVVNLMSKSMASMGSYIILVFFAAQFVAYFSYTNIGTVIAVQGADFLKNIGLKGIPLILLFIIVAAFINIFVGSASAKWAIMGPIFVPMFLLLGYDPALTQVAYRIGDSITNPLSPLFPYFPVILAFAKKYDKNIGMGTIIANMLPYSIVFAIAWIILLLAFMIFNIIPRIMINPPIETVPKSRNVIFSIGGSIPWIISSFPNTEPYR